MVGFVIDNKYTCIYYLWFRVHGHIFQSNCDKGLHFSAFHIFSTSFMTITNNKSINNLEHLFMCNVKSNARTIFIAYHNYILYVIITRKHNYDIIILNYSRAYSYSNVYR